MHVAGQVEVSVRYGGTPRWNLVPPMPRFGMQTEVSPHLNTGMRLCLPPAGVVFGSWIVRRVYPAFSGVVWAGSWRELQ